MRKRYPILGRFNPFDQWTINEEDITVSSTIYITDGEGGDTLVDQSTGKLITDGE